MIAIASLLITLSVSLLVTRAASVALTLTGLSQEVAKFQARSAFTGCGFTSNETEAIVNHPVRRRIISTLMLFGNIGIAAVIASTIATFLDTNRSTTLSYRFVLLGIGLIILWFISTRAWVDRFISRWMEWALIKWTKLDVRDYVSLLHLKDGFVVLELQVNDADWIADKSLTESRLALEGVLVLGIHRNNGSYIGSPNGKTRILGGDTLSLYGPINRLEELDIRKKGYAGDRAHQVAIEKRQKEFDESQEISDDGVQSEDLEVGDKFN